MSEVKLCTVCSDLKSAVCFSAQYVLPCVAGVVFRVYRSIYVGDVYIFVDCN